MLAAPTILLVASLVQPIYWDYSEGAAALFLPINPAWQHSKSSGLELEVTHQLNGKFWGKTGGELTSPKKTVSMKPVGNSFFRAISYCLTGNEENHRKIRAAVFNYIRNNLKDKVFKEYLDDVSQSLTEVTDIEISATARMLKTAIVVYVRYEEQWQWRQYLPDTKIPDENAPCIYLKLVFRRDFKDVDDKTAQWSYFDVIKSVK